MVASQKVLIFITFVALNRFYTTVKRSVCLSYLFLFAGLGFANAQIPSSNPWAVLDSLISANRLLDARNMIDSIATRHPEEVTEEFLFRKADVYYLMFYQSKEAFGIVKNEWLLTSTRAFNQSITAIYQKKRVSDKQLERLQGYVNVIQKSVKGLLDQEEFTMAYNLVKEAETSDGLIIKINKTGKPNNKLLYYRGLTADKLGRLQEAKKYYSRLIEDKVATRDVFHNLADVHKRLDDYAAAITLLEKAVTLFPDDKDLIIDWVTFSILAGEEEYLIEALEKQVANDSLNPEWYFIMASVYDNLNRFAEAEYYYKESLRIDTTFVDAQYNLATLYYNQAVECNKIILSDTTIQSKKDSVLLVRNQFYRKALPYFELSKEVDPVSIEKIILQLKKFKAPTE